MALDIRDRWSLQQIGLAYIPQERPTVAKELVQVPPLQRLALGIRDRWSLQQIGLAYIP